MLQHRKLVELVAAIIDEPFDQFGLDCPSGLFDRFADRLLELAAGQIRHQILRGAHRFRQSVEKRAIADEVRTHGDQHAHVFDSTAVGVQQDLHELGRFVARARFLDAGAPLAKAREAETEQFLELIDDQNKRSVAEAAGFGERAPAG